MSGKWYLGTRGTNPRPWDEWQWTALEQPGRAGVPTLVDMANLIRWAEMGQHVRLEFVPYSVAGNPDETK